MGEAEACDIDGETMLMCVAASSEGYTKDKIPTLGLAVVIGTHYPSVSEPYVLHKPGGGADSGEI